MRRIEIFMALAVALLGAPAAAQTTTGGITGVVQDAGGGVLPHVTVTATHDATNAETIAISNDVGLYVLRHSTAHVLAQAVLDLFPGARYAIGPPIADGFYYDFELPAGPDGNPAHFTEADLDRIDARMREIVGEAQPFVREELDRAGGLELFADQPFKREIIEGAEGSEGAEAGVVSVYRNPARPTATGSWTCAGARTCRPQSGSAPSS